METNVNLRSYLPQFFLRSEMFQEEFVEKIKTHVLYSVTSTPHPTPAPAPENRTVYKSMWKNTAERDTLQMKT